MLRDYVLNLYVSAMFHPLKVLFGVFCVSYVLKRNRSKITRFWGDIEVIFRLSEVLRWHLMRLCRLKSQNCVYKLFQVYQKWNMCHDVEQNIAGTQVFSTTVGWLGAKEGQTGSQEGQNWVKHGSRGSPGSCRWVCGSCGSYGSRGPLGKWIYEKWLLGLLNFIIWVWWATSLLNGSLGL